jgi:hypothetical protein
MFAMLHGVGTVVPKAGLQDRGKRDPDELPSRHRWDLWALAAGSSHSDICFMEPLSR